MSGYDPDRFVNVPEFERSELTCGICYGILNNPLVANCCLQTYCMQCINDWIKTNKSCPTDRQYLDGLGLRQPPRVLTNLLSKLQISCDHKEKGCQEILLLEDLSKHTTNCAFNYETCNTCACILKSGHNCVKELLALKESLEEVNEILRTEKESLLLYVKDNEEKVKQEIEKLVEENVVLINEKNSHKDMNDLKDQNQCIVESVSKLSKSLDKFKFFASNLMPEFESIQWIRNMITECRKHLDNPMVIECTLSPEMSHKIVNIVCNEMKINDNLFFICQNVVQMSGLEFGGQWYCWANYGRSAKNYIQCNRLIKIKFSCLQFKIFQTKTFDLPFLQSRIRSARIKREIKVLESDMTSEMVSYVREISFNALETCETLGEIVSQIQTSMEIRYPGLWQCFAYDCGEHCVHKMDTMSIKYEIEELKLMLF